MDRFHHVPVYQNKGKDSCTQFQPVGFSFALEFSCSHRQNLEPGQLLEGLSFHQRLLGLLEALLKLGLKQLLGVQGSRPGHRDQRRENVLE